MINQASRWLRWGSLAFWCVASAWDARCACHRARPFSLYGLMAARQEWSYARGSLRVGESVLDHNFSAGRTATGGGLSEAAGCLPATLDFLHVGAA